MDSLLITTYNCRGLPKDRIKLKHRPDIMNLFENNHIIAFQETWLSKQNLRILNSLHSSFDGLGVAKVDESNDIIQGRYSGGVAFMWHKDLGRNIKRIDLSVDWCVAIEVNLGSTKFILFNVYLPFQCFENEDEYISCLGYIKTFLEDIDCTNFLIMGDWNANLGNSGTTIFRPYMLDFCEENQLFLSSQQLLPDSTYTHVQTRQGNYYYSWLDHIVSSLDCHNSIESIKVQYDMTDDDHIPVSLSLQVDSLPKLCENNDHFTGRINWECATDQKVQSYYDRTTATLGELTIPIESLCCNNGNCDDRIHKDEIEQFFNAAMAALSISSDHFKENNARYTIRPGWNEYVSDIYDFSREARRMWLDNGQPRQGPIHNMYVKSKLRFKCALRHIKRNESDLRKESLARKLSQLSKNGFWREISSINNSKIMLPASIENATGAEEITGLWKNHYESLFNCLKKNNTQCYNSVNDKFSDMKVTVNEVIDAIKNLELNKSCGADNIYAEHLKYASERLIPILSMCFTGFFVHGFLPTSLLAVVLVPIIKNKAGNVNSIDNYRPVALSSIVSKILETIILNRIEIYLLTNANQFGFKKNHGTDMCIYTLKEIINMYTSLKSCVFTCFLDASKAFDRVNHSLLFEKLANRGIPVYILRILIYWYNNQSMCVRWGSSTSEYFKVTNGVRQGSILSPYFFNVYVDDLSKKLNSLGIGCVVGTLIINHILYADDLVLISPSSRGLYRLLRECEKYGIEFDIVFNANKSYVMCFMSNSASNFRIPDFYFNDNLIPLVNSIKYLGHYLCDTGSDALDIDRQRKKIFIQGNSLIRKFHMCTVDVKLTLFQSFIAPMYTAHLWTRYSNNEILKLYRAYHNTLKMFLGLSKREHTSPICAYLNVRSCPAVIRNFVFRFMVRLRNSSNSILQAILGTSVCYKSSIWKHWRSLLYTNV